MILTLNIDINNNKAKAFLDFIKIKEDNTDDFTLTQEHINILDERKQKHLKKESKSFNWDEIKSELINS
jgi:hypothetical protein